MNADQHRSAGSQAVASDRGVPPNLVTSGVVVGLVLVLLGLSFLWVGKTSLLASLLTCVGFGLVLASFGSKAGGSWAGWTTTGAGAMAIILFLILQHYTPTQTNNHFKRGQLRGDLSKIADLRIIDEAPMYEFRDRTASSIKFVIEQQVKQSTHEHTGGYERKR
jgi:hypothetical protein